MLVSFDNKGVQYKLDIAVKHNLTIPVKKQYNVNCYHLDEPEFTYFENEYFVGSLKKGGSVNCEKISFYPHASGTHTECALHVVDTGFTMLDVELPILQLCRVLTVHPLEEGDDYIINAAVLKGLSNAENATAICVRTLPNQAFKKHFKYAGTNPPFFTTDGIAHIKSLGFQHILTDLPSIDKEQDEGLLAAHKQWFVTNGVPDINRTITEFIFVDDQIKDGLYALSIQVPKMETDAVPSNVILYPCH